MFNTQTFLNVEQNLENTFNRIDYSHFVSYNKYQRK